MASLLHRGLEQAADRFGDREAVRERDASWSFADLDGLANTCARHLAGQGIGAGDRVVHGITARPAQPPCCSARRGRAERSTTLSA